MREPVKSGTILKNPEDHNEYQIEEKINEGGFGITYKAVEFQAGGSGTFRRIVCIKELYPKDFEGLLKREDDLLVFRDFVKNEEREELLKEWKLYWNQFRTEANTLFELKKRNDKLAVPKPRAFFKRNDLTCYLVMDFVEGKSLSNYMNEKKLYSVNESMQCLQPVFEVLKELHCMKLIHADVHPDNILVDRMGKGHLIDLGNVTGIEQNGKIKKNPKTGSRSISRRTSKFDPIRIVEDPVGWHSVYAPYEFNNGIGPWGTFSDVASLAGILYVMLTNSEEALRKYNRGYVPEIDPIRKYNRSVPREVDRVTIKALNRDYDARYQTVEEFWTDLQEAYFHKLRFIAKNIFPKTSNRGDKETDKNDQTELHEEGEVEGNLVDLSPSENGENDVVKQDKQETTDSKQKEIERLRFLAEHGDAEAQFILGVRYANGQGVEQSDEKAVGWYRKAAEQGDADAQKDLGRCYYYGAGMEQSYEKAVEWLRKAAEQGNADAQCNLGYCYARGQGVEQSYEKAVEWYRKAAEQGNASAQYNLGNRYAKGQGVEQSFEEAVEWYRKAAEQGNASAQYNLGCCYEKGGGVEQSNEKAVGWYRKAAEQGNASAQYYLGVCYENGQGVEQSDEKAVEWYQKATEQGNADAQCNLGYCYAKGQGVEQSYEKAVEWYRKAAEQGLAEAQNNLGNCYKNGQGVEQSYEKAAAWYQKAAEQGNARAQFNFGYCYENGQGVEQSYEKAVEWYRKAAEQGDKNATNKADYLERKSRLRWEAECYRKAAEQGNVIAQLRMGRLYEEGDNGVERSYEKAAEWYQKAAEQGDEDAQLKLGRLYEKGNGVERSYEKAAEWYQEAAERGNVLAQGALERLKRN